MLIKHLFRTFLCLSLLTQCCSIEGGLKSKYVSPWRAFRPTRDILEFRKNHEFVWITESIDIPSIKATGHWSLKEDVLTLRYDTITNLLTEESRPCNPKDSDSSCIEVFYLHHGDIFWKKINGEYKRNFTKADYFED